MDDLEITIFDADGNVVEHHVTSAQTATDAEINEMVGLIEGGCHAYIAAMLVRKPCAHVPKKAALDSSVWCIRCAAYLGEAH